MKASFRLGWSVVLAMCVVIVGACGNDESVAPSDGGSAATGGDDGGAGSTGGSDGGTGNTGGAADGGGSAGGDGGAGGGPSDVVYAFDFDGADGSSWPSPWAESGGVAVADLQNNRARFQPLTNVAPYALARLALPGSELDSDSTFTVVFSDVTLQGFGFYARQNGGHLTTTNPAGEGYAVFVTNTPETWSGIGLWVEENGSESPLASTAFALQNDTPYRVRFRVTQQGLYSTLLQARIWIDGENEPSTWHVETNDSHNHMQGVMAGFAVDAYWAAPSAPADLFFDDLRIAR